MHAIGISTYGAPDVLAVVERPEPPTVPGHVRIRVTAAAVNPTDLMLRSGELAAYMSPFTPPFIPGMDASGHLEETGPGVTGFSVGDRVMAFVNPFTALGGAQAESISVPADQVVRVPESVPLVDAAGLPMNGLTAHQALGLLALPPGATLAVTGGAGALGGYAVQLARHRGLRVVADAYEADRALLTRLGADLVVTRGANPAETVAAYRRAVPDGADGLIDAAVLGEPALSAVRDGGGLVKCRPYDAPATRGIQVHQAFVVDHPGRAAALQELAALAERGVLTPRTAEVLPPSEVARAHRLLEEGGVRGRLIVAF
ncbi:NADP-dependent oxidoreductase [Streptomyces sp. WMMC940]|uniref:NADP-dependent oxidoreductase n=1 Tax=Streptomyces sp. WMMC940 TaxID=3015153 RepID=UPI0022B66CF4|nr:NADP-dependent oxidoreductase [Streptomyces sp. WMMC940]MCZ7459558.1 NADP-dependent oxidoreductase [Streptomyces sp. WMMC940]